MATTPVKVVIQEIVQNSGATNVVVNDLKKIDTASQNTTKNAKLSWTEFNSALEIAAKGAQILGDVWQETGEKTLKYASQVRSLSQISGQSAEDTSRFIQVLDDYKISAEDAETATRKLTQNGYAPSLDTLAKLSDQYLKLGSSEEKNKFILDNLGRAGLQWVDVLNKGSDAIKKQGAAVSDNLILTQKQIDDARRLEIQEDALNDALEGVKITIGTHLIPVLHDAVSGWELFFKAVELSKSEHISFGDAIHQVKVQMVAEEDAMLNAKETEDQLASSTANLEEEQKAAAETAKYLSGVYTGLISSMFSIQKQNDSYAQTLDDISKKEEDLTAQKNRLTLQMWEEQKAGKLTNDEQLRYVQQLAEITQAQEDNQAAKQKAVEDDAKASKQREYDLVQQKLAADGVVDSGEYDYLQNLAVSYGLVSRAAAEQAIAENKRADALVSSFEQTLPPMERSLQVMQNLAALSGTVVDFSVNFQSNQAPNVGSRSGYQPYSVPVTPITYTTAGGQKATSHGLSRDSGGVGIAGTPYLIGAGAQPEAFIPSSNGTFVPNADKKGLGGNTYNITVYNPKKETAENSIRSALISLSVSGVAE